MLLVIDIGNTNTVMGIYDDDHLLNSWRLQSSHTRTVDEYWINVKLLCENINVQPAHITGIIISSVVPNLQRAFSEMAQKYFSVKPVIVTYRLKLGLKVDVEEPAQVGADRLCNAVAAKAVFTTPLVILDLGTATTFDVVDNAGNYIGGAIAPGLVTGSSTLFHKAAQLSKIGLKFPKKNIGKTTAQHMQSGIMTGHLAMIEGVVRRMEKELAQGKMNVIATGGFAPEFSEHTDIIDTVSPDLTLEGLRLIFEMNKPRM